jgi:hypothetical protein
MGCPTSVIVGDNLVFSICTHDPDTGVLTDAGGAPAYRVYEDETATPILTGTMDKLDDANTTGFYTELIPCTIANGFEYKKTYTVYIEATVDGDTGGICYGFKTESGSQIVLSGLASAGSSTTITLTGGIATAGTYDGCLCVITGGAGVGQSRTILSYAADTVATVTRDWVTAPDGTSVFEIYGADIPAILESGTATAGSANTITLDSGASGTANIYKDNFIMITGGVGIGQTRLIGAYSAGRVVTVVPAWTTQPDSSSVYQIVPMGRVDIAGVSGSLEDIAEFSSVVEGTYTLQDTLKLLLAYLGGKASGGGTNTVTFRDTGDTTDRVVQTVDANGNRSAVVLDVT